MIKFSKLFETVYEPRSGDEKNFKDKHIVAKHKTPFESESQFTSNKSKAKRKADYDTKDDESVYEAADVHTKRADKEAVIVRAVDPKTGQSKARVVQRRAGEIKIGEEVELGEKVANPYAIGMAAAMKKTGDKPPLKKSTIVKGHEIAKSIMKNEAMDKVGKEDDDIDNDGDVDKSDKYLHARRKAIGKALRKESIDEAAEYTMKQLQKKFKDGTHEAMNDPVPGRHVELRNTKTGKRTTHYVKEEAEVLDEISKKTLGSYIRRASIDTYHRGQDVEMHGNMHNKEDDYARKRRHSELMDKARRKASNRVTGIDRATRQLTKEEADLNEADVKYVIKHKKTKQVLNTHDDYATAKDEHEGLGNEKSEYGVYKQTKKDAALRNRNTYREEVEYIDEAVKIGAMKLHDGSSIIVTREMADKLNNVLEQLNPTNRVKMEEKLHTSKKDFMELLKFAENV